MMLYYFFCFQAEDGIRDLTVTGVQTCALPISETVKELPRGMHRERRRLLAMKRTQPRKILRPRLLQLDVIAHHADDIRLLLERVREIARVGHGWSGP